VDEKRGERIGRTNSSPDEQLETFRQIASDVAHDLNNLLLLISGYSEILSRNLDDREQVLDAVRRIQNATSGVKELTQKLQRLGQIDSVETSGNITRDGESPNL